VKAIGITLIALAPLLWVIGGSIIVARHYMRRGLPWYSGLKLFAFPFRHFDRREWLTLGGLLVLVMALGILGGAVYEASRAI
jgi:hypothetical protein